MQTTTIYICISFFSNHIANKVYISIYLYISNISIDNWIPSSFLRFIASLLYNQADHYNNGSKAVDLEAAFVSVGKPLPGLELRITRYDNNNNGNQSLNDNNTKGEGCLEVKGKLVTPGYYNNPQVFNNPGRIQSYSILFRHSFYSSFDSFTTINYRQLGNRTPQMDGLKRETWPIWMRKGICILLEGSYCSLNFNFNFNRME